MSQPNILLPGTRVQLIKDNCPRKYWEQSKDDNGVIDGSFKGGYWIIWDNGHRNCYSYNQVEVAIESNRKSLWALKR